MKCLLLAPARYPFINAIEAGLKANEFEVKRVDFPEFFPDRVNHFIRKFTALPRRIKNTWEEPYVRKVNENYYRLVREYRPDLVLIYNNQLVRPEFIDWLRGRARIAFMLGDNPFYTNTSIYDLHILFQADYVLAPDTLWVEQLGRLGVRNIVFDCFGFTEDTYYPMEPTPAERAEHDSDLVYVASMRKNNWGYKRTLFLNHFRDLDLRAYISGEGMERWLEFYPELRPRLVKHNRYDAAFNNLVYNCSKIAPIEQVPSLFNGVHVRVFDVLGSGILPLCEYASDLERVFEGIDIPLIRHYGEAAELARYWLDNDAERRELVARMRHRALTEYSPEKVIRRMVDHVFNGVAVS